MGLLRIHRAWWVAPVTMAALVAAAGFRSSTGALLEPLEHEFGWSRGTTSGAVSLNLVIYGLTAPFAAALMERFGIRRVVAGALALVAAGAGLTLVMNAAWQLWFLWGVPIGVGTGAMALVFGAIVANRWFVRHRGLVTGLFSAASSTGQLVFLPAIAQLADGSGLALGRRAGGGVRAAAGAGRAAGDARPALRRRRAAVRRRARRTSNRRRSTAADPGPARLALRTLRAGQPALDLLGAVPDLLDLRLVDQRPDRHPLHPGRARPRACRRRPRPNLLALIGIFDIVGTIASGWLTDRVDPRYLLFVYYLLRGLSLLVVPSLLGPTCTRTCSCSSCSTGSTGWRRCRRRWRCAAPTSGWRRSGVVFGWVFAAHMVGAGVAASYAGWMRERLGDYFLAWMTAGGLCLLAALMCLSIPRDRGTRSVGARAGGRGDGADLRVGAAPGQPLPQLGLAVQPCLVTLAALGGDGGQEVAPGGVPGGGGGATYAG